MDITINIDDLILNKDLIGVSTLYRELHKPTDFNCDIIFTASRPSLNLQLPFKQFYGYWELLINRSGPKTTTTYGMTFLTGIFQNVSAITFLMDVVITYKTPDKITEYLSDVTRKVDGFNIFPVADK